MKVDWSSVNNLIVSGNQPTLVNTAHSCSSVNNLIVSGNQPTLVNTAHSCSSVNDLILSGNQLNLVNTALAHYYNPCWSGEGSWLRLFSRAAIMEQMQLWLGPHVLIRLTRNFWQIIFAVITVVPLVYSGTLYTHSRKWTICDISRKIVVILILKNLDSSKK